MDGGSVLIAKRGGAEKSIRQLLIHPAKILKGLQV